MYCTSLLVNKNFTKTVVISCLKKVQSSDFSSFIAVCPCSSAKIFNSIISLLNFIGFFEERNWYQNCPKLKTMRMVFDKILLTVKIADFQEKLLGI